MHRRKLCFLKIYTHSQDLSVPKESVVCSKRFSRSSSSSEYNFHLEIGFQSNPKNGDPKRKEERNIKHFVFLPKNTTISTEIPSKYMNLYCKIYAICSCNSTQYTCCVTFYRVNEEEKWTHGFIQLCYNSSSSSLCKNFRSLASNWKRTCISKCKYMFNIFTVLIIYKGQIFLLLTQGSNRNNGRGRDRNIRQLTLSLKRVSSVASFIRK